MVGPHLAIEKRLSELYIGKTSEIISVTYKVEVTLRVISETIPKCNSIIIKRSVGINRVCSQ